MGNCCQKAKVIPDPQVSDGTRVKNGGWKRKLAKRMKLAKFSPRVDISTEDCSTIPGTSSESNIRTEPISLRVRASASLDSGTLHENDSTLVLFYVRQDVDEVNDVDGAETVHINASIDEANDITSVDTVNSFRPAGEATGIIQVQTTSTHKSGDCEDDFTRNEILEAPCVEEFEVDPPQVSLSKQNKINPSFPSKELEHVGLDDIEGDIEEYIGDEASTIEKVGAFSSIEDDKSETACAKSEITTVKLAADANEINNGGICMTGKGITDTRLEGIRVKAEHATKISKFLKKYNKVTLNNPVKRGKICKAYLQYLKSLKVDTAEKSQNEKEDENCKDNTAAAQTSQEITTVERKDNNSPVYLPFTKTICQSVLGNDSPAHKDEACEAKTFTTESSDVYEFENKTVKYDTTRKDYTAIAKTPEKRVKENSNVVKRNITGKLGTTKRRFISKRIKIPKRHKVRKTDASFVHATLKLASENSKAVTTEKLHKPKRATKNCKIAHRNKIYKSKANFEKIPKAKDTQNVETSFRNEAQTIESTSANMHKIKESDVDLEIGQDANTTAVNYFKTANANKTYKVHVIPTSTPETQETPSNKATNGYKIFDAYSPTSKHHEIVKSETTNTDEMQINNSIPLKMNKEQKIDCMKIVNDEEIGTNDSTTVKAFETSGTTYNEVSKMDQTKNKENTASITNKTEKTENKIATKRIETLKTSANSVKTPQTKEIENVEEAKSNEMCKAFKASDQTQITQTVDSTKFAKAPPGELLTYPIIDNSKVIVKCDSPETETNSLDIETKQKAGNNDYLLKIDPVQAKQTGGLATKSFNVDDKCVSYDDELSEENTTDGIKRTANVSEPIVGTSKTTSKDSISTADGTSNRPVSGFVSKSEPTLRSNNSYIFENLKPTKSTDTYLSGVNEELKRKISQASEESLEKLGNHDGKTDCLLNIFVHPADPSEEPKPVQVRAPSHMMKDGSAKTFVKNLERSIVKADMKKFSPLGKPKKTSKQHMKKSSTLVISESNHKVNWTQKKGPVSDVQLTQVPQYYEPGPKRKNMREKLGLEVLQKFKIQVQCKQIERLKVGADLFPGILPPKMKEKLNRKMEARKPIN